MQDPEEEHEFLEQLLRSRELNCLVKAHNVILFCNQEQARRKGKFKRIYPLKSKTLPNLAILPQGLKFDTAL